VEGNGHLQDVEFVFLRIPFVGVFSFITEILNQAPHERTYVTAVKNIVIYFVREKCGTAHCGNCLFNPSEIACVCHVICTEKRDS
jgi:hypothetical protein